ncbi:hypothetical protein [Parabacteroides goldsteinii]|uniref:hypothetical protein n=1 Tax=Parabacteroides goldsteinii TaxID=328812 RepID=UPI003AEF5F8B
MAVVIVQRPDPISLTGNIKELVIQSDKPVGIILSGPGGKTLEETYYPGKGNLVHIGLREVIEPDLSFTLPSSDVFIQPRLSGTYTLSYNSEAETGEILFTAIRGGKLNLTESAASFLTGNFLTWQPNCKPVTYYSPEWLTYFAPSECLARLKAYWEDGTNTIIRIAQFSANSCITMNMQYAVVSGKFDNKRPMYYDVWIEDIAGTRLSYVQRYIGSERQGENEQWYLFENSLGGLDSLRAYGSIQNVPEYTHNLSGRGDESEEYRIDVNRLFTRNTGYLTPDEARWLQDLFPARRKYVYSLSGLLPIVLTESDGHTDTTDLPSSYTFTYRLSDTRPYLDIQRRTDLPDNLVIPVPTGDTFFLPPRLAEFPKPLLSSDLLIPIQEPHTEKWGTTTTGAIHDKVLNDLVQELDGLELNASQGGVEIVDSKTPTSMATEKNVFSAFASLVHFLRKDAPDVAEKLLKFLEGAEFGIFESGPITGTGGKIWANGHAELASLLLRGWLEVPEIRYNRVQVVGGELWVTDGAKFDTVTQSGDLFNIKIKLEEGELVTFWVGDILKGVYHDKSTDGKFKGFRTLWFRVTAVDQTNQTITVASRYPGDSKYNPVQYLDVARIGSFTEASRQRSILIDSKENCITFLDHVNTWDITPGMEVCWLGRKDRTIPGVPSTARYNAKLSNIIMSGKIFQYDEISGNDYLVPIDKGTYVSGQQYAYYDRVSAPGGLWLCVNESGTTSAPVEGSPDWLLQVSDGTSLTPAGNWNSGTTYSKGQIVYLDGDSFFYTSNTPSSGIRPKRNPGGFLTTGGKQLTTGGKRLYTGDPYHPWQLLAEAGKDGFSIVVQYSADKINWHDTFNPDADKYMRQLQKDGSWTEAMQIVGEDGQESPYTSFQFAVNSSLTDAPTSGWQDAPPTVGQGEYLWMRSGLVVPPATGPESWTAVRIGGVKGDKGINYITEDYSPYKEYKVGDVVSFNGGKIYCKKDNIGQTPVPFLSTGGKLLKTGNFYLLYKPLAVNTINSEYWEIFVDRPVKEEIEQTFTTYFVGSPNVIPPTPILTGNSLGWSTTVPTTFNWVSQKRAISIASGSWSKPVRMTAEDGKDGLNATTRWLTSTTAVVRFNSIGNPTPSSVVVSCKKQTGILSVEACSDLYLTYRTYADTTYVSQSTPTKTSSVTIGNLRTDGVYYVRGYEKESDAKAWNGNFTTEFTITHANDGEQGERGLTGASPRVRGIWDKSISDYVWNNQWRDIVFVSVNGVNQQYAVKAEGTVPANINPTTEAGKSYWEPAQQFKFIATDLLLADKIKGDMIDTNTLKAKFIQTDSGGIRIEISPHEYAGSNLLKCYDGANKLAVQLGAFDNASSGFIGVYTDASANINADYHTILHRDEIEFSYRATPTAIAKYGRIRMKEGGFTLYSNSWLSENQVSSGEIYKDTNGYLRVK